MKVEYLPYPFNIQATFASYMVSGNGDLAFSVFNAIFLLFLRSNAIIEK